LDRSERGKVNNNYGKSLIDLPSSVWRLLTNWVYLASCFGACMELVIIAGFVFFLPKYLETQFSLSKSEASMVAGGTAIPGACLGILLGGFLLKKFSLGPRAALQLVLGLNVACFACYGLILFLGCSNPPMAGITVPYSHTRLALPTPGDLLAVNLTSECNQGCFCSHFEMDQVCDGDGVTYFSPCHAGCSRQLSNGNFAGCSCIHHKETTRGACPSKCGTLVPFMVVLFLSTLLVAATQMPLLMVVLRSVREEEKAFALGIQFVIFRLFGYIPSPIIFGHVVDSTCLLWKETCSGADGRCLLYDIDMFRIKYVGIGAAIKVVALSFYVLTWWLMGEKKGQGKLTTREIITSIISLDKIVLRDEMGELED